MTQLTMAQLDNYASNAGFSGMALSIIVGIAMAESGGRTDATNSVGNSAGVDRGVLQINSFYHSEVPDSCAFDATCSFKEAFRISRNGTSFSPWATFNNGSYKKFLNNNTNIPVTNTATNVTQNATGNILTDWIASIQPLIAWMSQPTRIFKMLTGIALVVIGIYMLIQPEDAHNIAKKVMNVSSKK